MAVLTRITNAAAQDALDAITALIGSGGYLRIYESSGTPPTDADSAYNGTILAECPLAATPFGAASASGNTAVATANAITADSSANASGTADYYRIETSGAACIWQGTVGTATSDLILNSVSISLGANVSITALTLTLPEYSGA